MKSPLLLTFYSNDTESLNVKKTRSGLLVQNSDSGQCLWSPNLCSLPYTILSFREEEGRHTHS